MVLCMARQEVEERIHHIVEKHGDDASAQIRELEKVVEEARRHGNIVLAGAAYQAIASTYLDLDNLMDAFDNGLKAKELLKDTNEYELLAKAYLDIGVVYYYQENFQMAILQDDRAYQIIEQHQLEDGVRIRALNSLAADYHVMGDCASSIRLLTECLSMLRRTNPDEYMDLAKYTLNIAESYRAIGELQKVHDVLLEMSAWVNEVPFKALVCDYYLRRALVSYDLGNANEGGRFLDDAFVLSQEASLAYPLYVDFRSVARILVRSGDLKRACRINEIMIAYAKTKTGTMEQLLACRTIADYYKHIGRHEQANEYYERADELFDQRETEQKSMQLGFHTSIRTVSNEMAKLKQEMRKKEELLSLEPLTKLLNRSALLDVASEFISQADKEGEAVGAIFIDIDFFKECNDTYGHAQGDEVIRTVASICKQEETSHVRFARYGGDEFCGITWGLDENKMVDLARRICAHVREMNIPNKKNPHGGRVTLSVGITSIAADTQARTIANVISSADKAMYQAKSAGKNAIYQLSCKNDGVTSYVRVGF